MLHIVSGFVHFLLLFHFLHLFFALFSATSTLSVFFLLIVRLETESGLANDFDRSSWFFIASK